MPTVRWDCRAAPSSYVTPTWPSSGRRELRQRLPDQSASQRGVPGVRVGVISDTHNPSVGVEPPPEVAIAFQGVDVILHAGDIYVPSCLDWLEAIAPVY
ncbi:MAG: metallophosphoesterase family protein, partial [Chloroflexi bacterium]|nr:metallophosphoesterase family protein [Chloroflexota bacterium]